MRNLSIASAGTAATLLAFEYENSSYDARQLEHAPGERLSDAGNMYGNGAFLAAGTVALWTFGHVAHDGLATATSHDIARGLVISTAITWTVKSLVPRDRPNGAPYSFPSGHTAGAFTVAPILAHRYGWKVGVPAYALAFVTGMGRIEDHKHYLSDVVAGATLGYIVGDAVVRHSNRSAVPGQLYVAHQGLGVRFRF
jgi:membrane-associated phospholipid phosphatase